jgi:hypothetical protein
MKHRQSREKTRRKKRKKIGEGETAEILRKIKRLQSILRRST